jgi:lipopolysaccharide transport system ATP-binding protein
VVVHVHERGALAFQVHDPAEGDSARGTFAGPYPGVVRPAFPWRVVRYESAQAVLESA